VLEDNLIVSKSIKDIAEKEINLINRRESPRNQCSNILGYKENEYKSSPTSYNINSNNNLLDPKASDNYLYGKFKNTREFQEYIDGQKMLMELEKIKDGEILEDNYELEIYDNQIDLREFEDISENDLILADFMENKNNLDMNYEMNENNNNMNNNVCELYFDCSLTNNIQNELESELGKELFQKVYRILSDNLNTHILSYDYDNLNKKIKQECSNYDEIAIDLSITRIPEIYCLLIKDREGK
jgi:hypothetical protein